MKKIKIRIDSIFGNAIIEINWIPSQQEELKALLDNIKELI